MPLSITRRKKVSYFNINHPNQPIGGRDLSDYERVLGFRKEDLEGRRVLDLGAGPEVRLATQLAAEGIGKLVVSMSPDFANRKIVKRARAAHPHNLVAGFGQQMDFPDRSFDAVVMLHVWEHLSSADFMATAKEVGRVLDIGGWARLGPLFKFHEFPFNSFTALTESNVVQELAESGVHMRQTPIPLEVMPNTRVQDHLFYTHYVPNYNLVLERPA